ncbi:hypothetical protein FJZ33_06595 [Candidatus Poribacteria bacterium]|nr:hypothetical protein [Candidatus Poribacteria bacterium]
MTDKIEGLVQSISINQVLVAILEEYQKLTVPTLRFLDASKTDKELVIDYDESGPSFTFSLRNKNEQQ